MIPTQGNEGNNPDDNHELIPCKKFTETQDDRLQTLTLYSSNNPQPG